MTYPTPRSRVPLVLLMALGLVLGSMAAPVAATSDGDGAALEIVRAQTLNTIDYKTGLLTDLKAGTDKPEAKAIYDEGLAELRELRSRAEASDSVDDLRAMDDKAHSVYHSTKDRASKAGKTDAELLEDARRDTLGTIDYKLGHFRDKNAATDNPEHQAIYAEAVGQLEALRPRAEASTSVDELHALKSEAHAIYSATKKKIEEAGDKKVEEEVVHKTEAEKAAEALANARSSTLRLIEYKVSLLTHAAEAAKNPRVAGVYADAADAVSALTVAAKVAKTTKALRAIDAQVMEIYEASKKEVADAHDQPDWQPSESVITHIRALGSAVDRLIGSVETTADQSPETAKAVAKAGAKVSKAIEGVEKAAETGKHLDSRWEDLRQAMNGFRRALAAHIVATTGAPAYVNGWNFPG
ncbi:MAG: hypothetical protein U9R47_02750 [Actinomycetota bacterium]|nr:hypothetical protein [Actinomycetota bacterium]